MSQFCRCCPFVDTLVSKQEVLKVEKWEILFFVHGELIVHFILMSFFLMNLLGKSLRENALLYYVYITHWTTHRF
jgi:hypothetical protein